MFKSFRTAYKGISQSQWLCRTELLQQRQQLAFLVTDYMTLLWVTSLLVVAATSRANEALASVKVP